MIKFVIGDKKVVRRVDLNMKLNEFRDSLKEIMPESSLFLMEDAIIEKETESDITIKDIIKGKEVYCSTNSKEINIILNDKNICKINISTDESIESLIKEAGSKIPDNSVIKFEDSQINFQEAKEQEMQIKDVLDGDSIYFLNTQTLNKKDNIKKKTQETVEKSDDEEYEEKKNKKGKENKENKEKNKFIHIYKNGEPIKMGLININQNISSLREYLKDLISEKAKFLSEGSPVPLKDEKSIPMIYIIKEEKIYIEDNEDTQSLSESSTKEKKKVQNKAEKKIPIIMNFEKEKSSMIKASSSETLDQIRINSNIPDNYAFTFKKTQIPKNKENEYCVGDILEEDQSIFLKNLRPKRKVKIIDDEEKSVKSEQELELDQTLSMLRKSLSLNNDKAFMKDKEIDVEDEDKLTVADIEKDGTINIVDKSINYSIMLNNSLIAKKFYSPKTSIQTLRAFLIKELPKECTFINSSKQTPIPNEFEENLKINQICDEDYCIYIESEEKKITSKNKPLESAKFLRKVDNLDYYLIPSQKFIIYNDLIKDTKSIDTTEMRKKSLEITSEPGRKIMMVMGQTGSGKTTLLNSFINALCGIKLQDDFRYIIIDEEAEDSGVQTVNNQANSRTSYVTAYNINSYNNHPPITIIDTPGFGDNRGIEFDNKIIDMIRDLFKNWIDTLDAICFVASSSFPRLTSTQQYIFSNVISLFGNDIAENFVPMLTFCDGKKPQFLSALLDSNSIFRKSIYDHIKEKDPWYLEFNNSAIFEGNRQGKFTELFWDLGMDSFGKFFAKLSTLPSKSLNHSKNVLDMREKIQNKILCLHTYLNKNLIIMENIKHVIKEIELNANIIDKARNFTIKVKKPKIIKTKLQDGVYTTTCTNCHFTCHKRCWIPNDDKKKGCSAMNNDGNCTVCPKKCHWTCHSNTGYTIEYTEVEEEETIEKLKKQYYDKTSELSLSQQIIKKKELELEKNIVECYYIQDEIKKCIEQLKKEALYPNVCETSEEYINLLIESEQSQKKDGYKDRIKSLESLKENHKLFNKIFKNGTACQDIEEFRRKIMEDKINILEGKNCAIKLTTEEKNRLCLIF